MLQNRVDPFGDIIETKARGAWMGNRGLLHNNQQKIVRPFKLNAWITCLLDFKERKRLVMAHKQYTELFFMDEATSFAAGHRPCAECRRNDYMRFKSFWLIGNPQYGFNIKTPIREIDLILRREKMNQDKSKITFNEKIENIPNGTFVSIDDKAYLVVHESLFLWSPFGYEKDIALPTIRKLDVLTPKSTVNTFRAGYLPQIADIVNT